MSDGLFPVEYSDLQTVCYLVQTNNLNLKLMQSVLQGNLFLTIRRVPEISQLAAKKGIENSAAVAEDSTSEKHPRIFWLPEEWAEDDRWGRFCRRENVFLSADFWLIQGDGLNLLTEKAWRNPVNKIFVPILG